MGLFDELKEKVGDVLDKTDIDEKVLAKAGELKDKAKEALEKSEIDDKIKAKAGELKDGKIPTLTIVIKPTDNASYKNMVDALDEMQILSIGTYVIDKISPEDEKMLTDKGIEM